VTSEDFQRLSHGRVRLHRPRTAGTAG
jgi:hypothetical protein